MAEFDFSASKRTSYSGRFPVFWRDNVKILPGGFKVNDADKYPVGTVIHRGAPLHIDFSTMTATIVGSAKLLNADSSTGKVTVAKDCYFRVGQTVAIYGNTKAGSSLVYTTTISAITYGKESDELTLADKTIQGLKANAYLVDAAIYTGDNSDTAPAVNNPDYINALVGEDSEIKAYGLAHVDPCYEAVVLEPCVPWAVLDGYKQGIALKANPNIIFIHQ